MEVHIITNDKNMTRAFFNPLDAQEVFNELVFTGGFSVTKQPFGELAEKAGSSDWIRMQAIVMEVL